MDLQVIAAPVIGGIIGLITNGLAIKMLFVHTRRFILESLGFRLHQD